MNETKRIYSFDFLKFIFAIVICLHHFVGGLSWSSLVVRFFFIVSGFFLAGKFYKKNADGVQYGAYRYTYDHIKSLYPDYLFGLVMLVLCYLASNALYHICGSDGAENWSEVIDKLYYAIAELFMVQNIGFYSDGLNYPMWQICTMLIAGLFIFALLCLNRKLSETVLFPVSIILIYTHLHNGADIFGITGAFYVPLLRAFAPMCLGVLLYRFTMTAEYHALTERWSIPFNIAAILSLVILLGYVRPGYIDLILSSIIVLSLNAPKSWLNVLLNRKCFKWCGKMSYALYVNHVLIILATRKLVSFVNALFDIELALWMQCGGFLVILIVYSICTRFAVEWLGKRRKVLSQ